MALLTLNSDTRKFYIGSYLAEDAPSDRTYHLPIRDEPGRTDIVLEHLVETSNVEELHAPPEDFELPPEEIQAGETYWSVNFSLGEEDFSNDPQFIDSLFYAFYYGAISRGRDPEPLAIAPSDFYTVPIED